MSFDVRQESALPDELGRLVEIGSAEGFRFVARLVSEWTSGENRFEGVGEVFLCVFQRGSLAGFGGLNSDPYLADLSTGRIRHVYIEPDARGTGLGGALVRELIDRSVPTFSRLRLSSQQAAPFYERLGFSRVDEDGATHALEFSTGRCSRWTNEGEQLVGQIEAAANRR